MSAAHEHAEHPGLHPADGHGHDGHDHGPLGQAAGSPAHDHGEHAGHSHAPSPDADRRYLRAALALLLGFMAVEVVIGILARSLALVTDAGHMLTDAAALALALVAMRLAAKPAQGRLTYGLKRVEILSAQANGLTLLALAVFFVVEGVRRLADPPDVAGGLVLVTALVGIVVNLGAVALVRRADRSSLNVEGAFQHLLTDLYAFVATAVAGLVVLTTGFARADALAALTVAALMLRAGWSLVRESWRVFLEAAPAGIDPDEVGAALRGVPGVASVHDLHVWQVTSGFPVLSAHVLVRPGLDCHGVRTCLEDVLRHRYDLTHSTLQVDHVPPETYEVGPSAPDPPPARPAGHPRPAHPSTGG